jgi:hypothetical protein
VDGQWLILDNVRLALVRDTDMIGSIPKFVLDRDGARRFVSRVRAGRGLAPAKRVQHNSSGLPKSAARGGTNQDGRPVVERTRSAQLRVSILLKADFNGEGAAVA